MHILKIAATGMAAQQMRVETISNNLANMSTTGYNARRAEFADLHYQQLARAGTINAADGTVLPTGVQLGLGVRPSAISVQLAQGSLTQTNGDLDLAIDGGGYLEVRLPSPRMPAASPSTPKARFSPFSKTPPRRSNWGRSTLSALPTPRG